MKRGDLAMIVIVAGIGIVLAFFITRAVFGEAISSNVKVKTIDAINSTIEEPNTEIFNENAINPAVEVQVGTADQTE